MEASHNQRILIGDFCENYVNLDVWYLKNFIHIIQRIKMLKSCQLKCWMIMQTWMLSSKKINPRTFIVSLTAPPLLMSTPFLDRFISMFHCQFYSYFNCHFHRLLLSDCVHFCHSLCFHRTFDASTLYRQNNFKGNAFDLISQVKCKGQDQKEFSENC